MMVTDSRLIKKEEQLMSVKHFIQASLILIMLATAFANTTGAQAWSNCGSTYVVQRGDWMAKIANRCGVTLGQLYAANSWARYYYYIYPGQILNIPGGTSQHGYYPACGPNADGYGSYYLVCRGDTLGGIALFYGTTVRYLQWRNHLADADRIYAGQILRPY